METTGSDVSPYTLYGASGNVSHPCVLRANGSVIKTSIAISCAMSIVKNHDSNLLQSNGGHISLTKNWAKYLIKRMGFVKRRASTTAKVSPTDFERHHLQFTLMQKH